MPKRNAMGDPVLFVMCCCLFFTCWMPTSTGSVILSGRGNAMLWRDGQRRVDPAAVDEWMPIDHGHPMRDDPTLVYVPPVVDPVHYGILTAEPLWPIRPSKMPTFILPPEALGSAPDAGRRIPSGFRSVDKSAVKAYSQPAQHRLDQQPVRPHQQPVQRPPQLQQNRRQDATPPRQPFVYPRMPVVPLHGWTDRERPRDHPLNAPRAVNTLAPQRPATQPQIGIPLNAARPTVPDRSPIDRLDDDNDVAAAHEPDGKKHGETMHSAAKKARKPFRPFEFVIQQGHSKVRKYGSSPNEPDEQQSR